ncbi:glycosyltransferase family 2 protein [Anabaena subtropica]|uniref:Glycosyltransferase family 2 protein n=1 Tax=Anabaena subtropica FACHB-260 TaxID=2692884 RepID=A0ABR8CT40_9NOST|nr:glycosyltransferase family A protein [Anabaena subtropica]MBD2345357.1 glycosyltransferase family 2 protein [Anabaena subtropica FACHB-260]
MPKVSIVIPAYNAMAYLPTTLETVFQQTFTDFEILIINDGSSDNIIDWVSSLTDSRIRLITQENQGLTGAHNTGVIEAKGEYIAFLDADDLWEPSKLEKQVSYLDKNPEVGLVDTWVMLIDEDGISTGTVLKTNAEGNVWQQIIQCPTVVCGSSPLVRNSCFQKVGLFDPEMGGSSDWDMWIRIAYRYAFGLIKEPLTLYRQHRSSMSKNCDRVFRENQSVIEKTFKSVPPELQKLKQRAYALVYLYLAWRALDNRNYEQALYYRQQAYANDPQVIYSKSGLSQKFAIIVTRLFGSSGLDGVRNISRSLRRNILALIP